MSFGISAIDIVLLSRTTARAHHDWRQRYGDDKIVRDLSALRKVLYQLESWTPNPRLLSTLPEEVIRDWQRIFDETERTVSVLADRAYRDAKASPYEPKTTRATHNDTPGHLQRRLRRNRSTFTSFLFAIGLSRLAQLDQASSDLRRLTRMQQDIDEIVAGLVNYMPSFLHLPEAQAAADEFAWLWHHVKKNMAYRDYTMERLSTFAPALKVQVRRIIGQTSFPRSNVRHATADPPVYSTAYWKDKFAIGPVRSVYRTPPVQQKGYDADNSALEIRQPAHHEQPPAARDVKGKGASSRSSHRRPAEPPIALPHSPAETQNQSNYQKPSVEDCSDASEPDDQKAERPIHPASDGGAGAGKGMVAKKVRFWEPSSNTRGSASDDKSRVRPH